MIVNLRPEGLRQRVWRVKGKVTEFLGLAEWVALAAADCGVSPKDISDTTKSRLRRILARGAKDGWLVVEARPMADVKPLPPPPAPKPDPLVDSLGRRKRPRKPKPPPKPKPIPKAKMLLFYKPVPFSLATEMERAIPRGEQ